MAISQKDKNAAEKCVDMWENSPGHLRNMLSTRHKLVSIGISFLPDGTYYCTQTFGIPGKGKHGGDRCLAISDHTESKGSNDEVDFDWMDKDEKALKCFKSCMSGN